MAASRRLFKISPLEVLVVVFFLVGESSATDAPALAPVSSTVAVLLVVAAALFPVSLFHLNKQAKINTQTGGHAIQDVKKIFNEGDLTFRDKIIQIGKVIHNFYSSPESRHHENIEAYPSTKPSHAPSSTPATIEVEDQIKTIYDPLPPRPTIDKVETAMAILRTVDTEEQSEMEDISNQKKPPGVKKNRVLLQRQKQRKVASTGDVAEELSLTEEESIIETSAENRAGVLDHQGKLMDQFEGPPVLLGKFSNITELNLSKNRIMALLSTIGGLKCLIKLDIHSNKIIDLHESFGELSNLADLNLHGNQLRYLPNSFGNLTSLVNLDLSTNQLRLLPETIGNLTSLKTMNVGENELKELPYTIGSCSSLIELRADLNILQALPEATSELKCLEILTLRFNEVKHLPGTMGSLSKLKELDVSNNWLESVHENLCFATNLVKLNVGSNFASLRSLPKLIGNLKMLEELDISNSQIKELPDSFKRLSKLKVLYADETPLAVPPREIVQKGAQAVVKYMADLAVKKKDVSFQPSKKRASKRD